MAFLDRVKNSWTALWNDSIPPQSSYGNSGYERTDKKSFTHNNRRSITSILYNRIAVDVSLIEIDVILTDENDTFLEMVRQHPLHYCLTRSANIDQDSGQFLRDCTVSLLDEGTIAIVPFGEINGVVAPINGHNNLTFNDLKSLRVGKVITWMPRHVVVEIYNENVGHRTQLTMPKQNVAIIENPFYEAMNQPNGTLKRLVRKMNMLDYVDEQNNSGKLNMIIQLPYAIRNEVKKKEAEQRLEDLTKQLQNNKYGIAYADATEKITPLSQALGNNLREQINDLKAELYNELGVPMTIFDGTATAEQCQQYYVRTIEPILSALVLELRRKFISDEDYANGLSIQYFYDPFRLMTAEKLASIGDALTRNEIFTSNEMRGVLGYKPSMQPSADELRNKNMPYKDTPEGAHDLAQMQLAAEQQKQDAMLAQQQAAQSQQLMESQQMAQVEEPVAENQNEVVQEAPTPELMQVYVTSMQQPQQPGPELMEAYINSPPKEEDETQLMRAYINDERNVNNV